MDFGIVSAIKTVFEDRKLDTFDVRKIDLRKEQNTSNELAKLCDLYGSDKATTSGKSKFFNWPPHDFGMAYERILGPKKMDIKSLFECGIGTNNPNLASNMTVNGRPGASLRVWRDYLPNAIIYGADIDKDILFNEVRIKTAWIDQTSPSAIKLCFDSLGRPKFDVIIDDGLHSTDAAITLFETAFSYLSDGGDYFIEDLHSWEITPLVKHLRVLGHNPIIWHLKSKWRRSHNNNTLVQITKSAKLASSV